MYSSYVKEKDCKHLHSNRRIRKPDFRIIILTKIILQRRSYFREMIISPHVNTLSWIHVHCSGHMYLGDHFQ